MNILHVLLGPIGAALRRRLPLPQQQAYADTESLVRLHVRQAADFPRQVQATFAQLQQTHPLLTTLYRDRSLVEPRLAEQAVERFQQQLAAALDRQRQACLDEAARGGGIVGGLLRVLLTLGAVAWFPFAQPVLEAYLSPQGPGEWAYLAVRVLGVSFLLENAAFLAVYFFFLWMALKWAVRRRVDRWLDASKRHEDAGLDGLAPRSDPAGERTDGRPRAADRHAAGPAWQLCQARHGCLTHIWAQAAISFPSIMIGAR